MKPVDLIIANKLHETADHVDALVKSSPLLATKVGEQIASPDFNTTLARDLLCAIAHNADIRQVFAALTASGAPSSLDEIRQRFQAVRESRAAEAPALAPHTAGSAA